MQNRRWDVRKALLFFGIGFALCVLSVGWLVWAEGDMAAPSASVPQGIFLGGSDIVSVVSDRLSEGLLWAGTPRTLYRTADGGRTWRTVFRSFLFGGPIQDMCVHPADSTSLYVVSGRVLFFSDDGGRRWARLRRFKDPVLSLSVGAEDPPLLLVETRGGIAWSSDGGIVWNEPGQETEGNSVLAVSAPAVPGDYSYVLMESGLFRFKAPHDPWERVFRQQDPAPVGEDPEAGTGEDPEGSSSGKTGGLAFRSESTGICLWTDKGMWLSRNSGDDWTEVPLEGMRPARFRQIVMDFRHFGTLYVLTPDGLFQFSAEARKWSSLKVSAVPMDITEMALSADGRSLWLGTPQGLLQVPVPAAVNPQRPAALSLQVDGIPSIRDVQEAAIRYADVSAGKISRWKQAAFYRHWLPRIGVSLDRDKDRTIASSSAKGETQFFVGPEDESVQVGFDLSWNLADLIWNPDLISIDTRSRLMVQLRQDILDEVTHLYFQRQRFLSEFEALPSDDPTLLSERMLRVKEVEARLDALTGGYFTDYVNNIK